MNNSKMAVLIGMALFFTGSIHTSCESSGYKKPVKKARAATAQKTSETTGNKEYSMAATSIQSLIDGYKQFRQQHFITSDQLYRDLVAFGQNPKAIIVACSDSRVDPAILTNCHPGDLFVARNIANMVPPCESSDTGYHGTSATLEFAITNLGISNIIVLGHSNCAGINSLFAEPAAGQPKTPKTFVAKWMELASPAYQMVKTKYPNEPLAKQQMLCGQYAVVNSLNNLRTFGWIREAEAAKELILHGWYFDMTAGLILAYNAQTQSWSEL